MKVILNLTILFLAAIALASCATPQTPELIQAQHAYSEARNNPAVANNAALTLQEAEKALNQAKEADDPDVQKHFAYIAGKKVELARVQADNAETEKKVAQLKEQQENFLLQLRQDRTEQAQQQAQQAQQELRAYRSQDRQEELESAQREAQQAKSELEQLRMEMVSRSEQTDAGLMLTLADVVFALDEAQLKPGAERGLGKLSDFLKKYPDRKILVEGFTDSTGSDDYNQELSEDRARAVAQALEADGISPARITTRGLGEQYPVATNGTEAGRQQNRRVEITILNMDRQAEDAGRRRGRI